MALKTLNHIQNLLEEQWCLIKVVYERFSLQAFNKGQNFTGGKIIMAELHQDILVAALNISTE